MRIVFEYNLPAIGSKGMSHYSTIEYSQKNWDETLEIIEAIGKMPLSKKGMVIKLGVIDEKQNKD